jgi:hypothetical protein
MGRSTRDDGLSVRAGSWVLLRLADLLDGSMGDREIDLPCGSAGFRRRQTQPSEDGLRDPVMSEILSEAGLALPRNTTLTAVPFHEAEMLERREMVQGRGRTDRERLGDLGQGGPVVAPLGSPNGPQRVDLAAAESLEDLHRGMSPRPPYMSPPLIIRVDHNSTRERLLLAVPPMEATMPRSAGLAPPEYVRRCARREVAAVPAWVREAPPQASVTDGGVQGASSGEASDRAFPARRPSLRTARRRRADLQRRDD